MGGIHPRTFERWLEQGERDFQKNKSTDYAQFYREIREANTKVKAVLEGRVYNASRSDPKLALQILERRWPKDWGLQRRTEAPEIAPPAKESPRKRIEDKLAAIEARATAAMAILAADAKTRTAE